MLYLVVIDELWASVCVGIGREQRPHGRIHTVAVEVTLRAQSVTSQTGGVYES